MRNALVKGAHKRLVFGRRTKVLRGQFAEMIPPGSRVLDVGCGDGSIDELIATARPDVSIEGIDVLVRRGAKIPVILYDGRVFPHPDKSFDAVIFIDVLHHTPDPLALLREAVRVARHCIIIKDHNRDGFAAGPLLRLMDWVGNAPHGVALPYNYWSQREWRAAFDALDLTLSRYLADLGLYPAPARWIFERSLHFVARLDLAPCD